MKEYSYWLDTVDRPDAPNLRAREPANLSLRYDVAIVGAGYTGLAAALRLARAGATVVVFERDVPGAGASSRNAGQVLTGFKLEPAALVARYGETRARELFDVSRTAIAELESLVADESISCGYERTGHVQAASKPSHFDAFREEQALLARVFDHDVELVPREEQRGEIGTGAYFGLMRDRRSGALNPAQYASGLAAAAVRSGASIASSAGVTSVERADAGWIVKTARGDVRARDVLFATDAYTDGAAPALQRRLVAVGSYVIVTAPLAPEVAATILPQRRMAFDSRNFLHYFRLVPGHRLLFGGRAEFSQPDANTTARAAGILRRDLEAVFPQLAGVAVDYAWSGHVAFARDQMPRAGRLDGIYYAAGYGGHGIAMATHLGDRIARRIAGEPLDHPLFDDTFPAIPLYTGTPWFLPLAGVYYRLLDLIS